MDIFFTNSNKKLAKKVARMAGLRLGKVENLRSPDGEIVFKLKQPVINKNVCVFGSSFPPAENLLEILILIDALRGNGAKKINVVIPYYGYAKSDHPDRFGYPVSARLIAKFLKLAGADKIISVNLHSERVKNFFKIPVVNLSAMPLLASYFKDFSLNDFSVASPDFGGASRAKEFAKCLGIKDIAIVEKKRPNEWIAKAVKISGGVKKKVILVDDMIQSGATIIEAAAALKEKGVKEIYVAATHLLYTGPAPICLIKDKNIKKIIITDTVPSESEKLNSKFKILSIADLLSKIF